MFDWPEQIQTSPTRTSLSATAVSPFTSTVSSDGTPTSSFGSLQDQSPSAFAVAPAALLAYSTTIRSPGAALPQIGTSTPRCKTMWSLKSGGRVTARVG